LRDPLTELSPRWQAALALAFGALTSLFVVLFGAEPMRTLDLLVLSASLAALATAGLWLWILAAQLSRGWGFAFALTLWIPYVNFVVASLFARRYWNQGARAPALLALLGMLGQAVATLRALATSVTAPV
jgi:hypothetical protein